MARWKLNVAHYLNVPGTEWEQKEIDQQTGKQARKIYPVPMYLDPKDKADLNYPQDDMIVVALQGTAHQPRDIIFTGDPTPDMEPLDDEAEKLSEKRRPFWSHPIEDLPGSGHSYAEARMQEFEGQIAAIIAKQGTPRDSATVSRLEAEVTRLSKLVETLMKVKAA
jgi:hypothetical protein